MDMFYIPAIASFSGSASGTLASIVTGWVTQRRKDRIRHSLRATSQREELYKSFIEEASRLYADALVNDKSEVSKLVDLYAETYALLMSPARDASSSLSLGLFSAARSSPSRCIRRRNGTRSLPKCTSARVATVLASGSGIPITRM